MWLLVMNPLFTSGEGDDPGHIPRSTGGPYVELVVYGLALLMPFIAVACAATLVLSMRGRIDRFVMGLILFAAAFGSLAWLVY